MNEVDFYIAQDNTSDPLEVTLQDDDGNAVDLTNASIKFVMSAVGSDTRKVDSNVAADGLSSATDGDGVDIDDATAGDVTYHWSDSDTDTAGYYNARFLVDYNGGTGASFDVSQSFPNVGYVTVRVAESV